VCLIDGPYGLYTFIQSYHASILFTILCRQNFQQECSLIEAAKASGYDYSYLSRTFKKKTGISFTEYVNQYRISQAAYLLSNTTDSISSIAFACGFNTIRSFNRNFKELIGIPPGEYRKSVPKSTMDNQPEIVSILSCQSL
jgi:AraC-like DNA-binding protein